MGFIEHLITNIFISLVLTIPFFLAVNIVLFLAAIGRPAHIEFVTGVRNTLRNRRPDMVLRCDGMKVSSVVYDRARDYESVRELYTGSLLSLLTWSGAPRSVKAVLKRAKIELAVSVCALILGYVPPVMITLILGVHVSSYWLLATVILTTAYAVTIMAKQMIFIRWRAFSGVVGVTLLHRFHLYPVSVWLVLSAFFAVVSLCLLPWVQQWKD
jgi:hypothetical protein